MHMLSLAAGWYLHGVGSLIISSSTAGLLLTERLFTEYKHARNIKIYKLQTVGHSEISQISATI